MTISVMAFQPIIKRTINMLKTFTQKIKHPCSVFLLVAIGCSFLAGCQTVGPEILAERNHRIKEINAKLHDNMQILLAYARQEDIDLDLANKALDGVFSIIGHPDSQEVLLAKCLDEKAINDLLRNSVDLKKERSQLVQANEKDSVIFKDNYHRFKESHETLTDLKWAAGLIAIFGVIALFIFKPKLF